MRKFLFITTLLITSLCWGQSPVTVTGTIQDETGNLATSGTVTFALQPQNTGVQFFINNVTVLAPTTATCGINGSGQVKNNALSGACQVWGNDVISPANTTYCVTYAPGGNITNTVCNELINGSNYNLNTPVFAQILPITPQVTAISTSALNGNIIPVANNVFTLGSTNFRYANAFINNLTGVTSLNISSITSSSANPAITGFLKLSTGDIVCWRNNGNSADLCISKNISDQLDVSGFASLKTPSTFTNGAATLTLPTSTGTLARLFGDTFTSTTLTSPVINGTPSGTGIPTVTVKKGTGAGNYTTANTTMTDVDGTNLSYTVTIPTGWKLAVQAAGSIGVATAVVEVQVQILDNAAVVDLRRILPTGTSILPSGDFALLGAITGDGASHTVKLQYKTTNGADSAVITNASNENPTMLFTLTPSN